VRWSREYKFGDFKTSIPRLNGPGVYEIGFCRGGIFNAKYIGISSISVRVRLMAHHRGSGNKQVAAYLEERHRNNLWFHFMVPKNFRQVEANLLNIYGIEETHLYRFNNRYEHKNLSDYLIQS